MNRPSRIKPIALAAVCVAVGVAIGFAIPRGASLPSASPGSVGSSEYPAGGADFREVFSPDIANDDYVRRERVKMVEALEQHCRNTGEDCQLAVAARQALTRR